MSYKSIINKIRGDELKKYKEIGLLQCFVYFLLLCAPVIVALASFGSFVLIDSRNKLDASTVFVSLSLFNILRFPLTVLPLRITNFISVSN